MATELKSFQRGAVERSYIYLAGLLSKSAQDRRANEQALRNGQPIDLSKGTALQLVMPPGMGKTITLAAMLTDTAIDLVSADMSLAYQEVVSLHDDLILWLTPGRGGLADQSYASLCEELGDRRVYRVGEGNGSLPTEDLRGSIVVSNYESLVQRNRSDGSWKNIVMRDGENKTYIDMLKAAKKQGVRVTIIIDEAHVGRRTAISAIGQFFDAIGEALGYMPLRIEATATPRAIPRADMSEGRMERTEVPRTLGVRAGLLREHLVVNARRSELGSAAVETVNEAMGKENPDWNGDPPEYLVITDIARRVRRDILDVMHTSTVQYSPLILVTVNDNPKGGEVEKQHVLDYFASQGWTVEGGDVIVWTAEEAVPLNVRNELRDNNSKVKVIITKVAPALGWDCPRAQILVSIRDAAAMKEDFSLQLLGRIQRQPGGTVKPDVNNDILNTAFAFTACKEGFIARSQSQGQSLTGGNHDVVAQPKLLDLWRKQGAQRRGAKRVNRTPVYASEFSAALQQVDDGDITDTGAELKELGVSDYRAQLRDGDSSDLVIQANSQIGEKRKGSAEREVVPQLTQFLSAYRKDGCAPLTLSGRHAGFSISAVRDWVKRQLNRQGISADPNLVILAAIEKQGGDLAAVFDKVFETAAAGEKKHEGNGWQSSDWKDYIPASSRPEIPYLDRGDTYSGVLAKTHLYGESKFDDGQGSRNEVDFENMVLGGVLANAVVTWHRSSNLIDRDGLSATLTYLDEEGNARQMFPDISALLRRKDGSNIAVLFEVKGAGGRDRGKDSIVKAKAKALSDLYGTEELNKTMAGAVVYPQGQNWVVMTGDGSTTSLTQWLDTIDVDLSGTTDSEED